jgi:Ca-activated chloride channel homolog
VKAQVEFNPAKVKEWRLIGYETRALQREDFNNDAVDAGELGASHQVTALYEITPVGAGGAVDPLRYQRPAQTGAARNSGEIGFLRLRYKLPSDATSRLIERPITSRNQVDTLSDAPEATRFAIAVAAYGQLLRQDPWMGTTFTFKDAADLAATAKGPDTFGLRGEFIDLVRKAETLERLPAGQR